MDLDGKVVAITGASSGIGRAVALLLASRHAAVVLGARRADRLKVVAEEITERGGQVAYQATDVSSRQSVQALVDLACERYGRLDVLVSSAGIGPVSRFDALKVEEWDAMIDINIRGVLHGIAAALPVFERQKEGHFINVISTAGLRIVPTMGVYAATKNAVRTITEALRQENSHFRVTEVSPGMIATNFVESITEPSIKDAMKLRSAAIAISPAAIAQGIAFAIEQPNDVDVGSIVIRPTAQD